MYVCTGWGCNYALGASVVFFFCLEVGMDWMDGWMDGLGWGLRYIDRLSY